MDDFKDITDVIRSIYGSEGTIPLHIPQFIGNEKRYLADCIDTTFVSSVGAYVNRIEKMIRELTGAKKAVAVVNGTAALHTALVLAGVDTGEGVITQPLTFVATCNAISYCGAEPAFVDVDRDTLGMSPDSLSSFLEQYCEPGSKGPVDKATGRRYGACVPMHTFGLPCRIEEIAGICRRWNLPLVEDAAESLGSFVKGTHTGLSGTCGILSFNGNKTVTTGGGGMIITRSEDLGSRAKHITTTAKIPHRWEFDHDSIAFNYRMPNINAALGCAQLERIDAVLESKRSVAHRYRDFFADRPEQFIDERKGARSNFWLNAVLFPSRSQRDAFLEYTNDRNIMTRPIWKLMNKLPMFRKCPATELPNAEFLEDRIVNLPSSVP